MNDQTFQKMIVECIEHLKQEKEKKKIFPTHVIDIDLHRFIKNIINRNLKELTQSGVLKTGQTINNIFYELKKEINKD